MRSRLRSSPAKMPPADSGHRRRLGQARHDLLGGSGREGLQGERRVGPPIPLDRIELSPMYRPSTLWASPAGPTTLRSGSPPTFVIGAHATRLSEHKPSAGRMTLSAGQG